MDPNKRDELRKLLANFDTGMLVSAAPGGELSCLPATLGRVGSDGRIALAAGIDGAEPAEPRRDGRYALICTHLTRHLALQGTLTLTRDRSLLKQAWMDRWATWFPKGVETNTIALLHFHVHSGEYWDHTGLTQLTYALEAARSFVRGAHLPPRHEQHLHL